MILGTKTKRLIRNILHLLHFGVTLGLFKDLDSRNNEAFQAKITKRPTYVVVKDMLVKNLILDLHIFSSF